MFKSLKKKALGFSLLEVIIAALIFTITAAGLLTAISMTRQPAETSTKKVQAIFRLKQFLDTLSSHVTANTWVNASSNLAVGVRSFTDGEFTITYNVTQVNALDPYSPRQVVANITFPD